MLRIERPFPIAGNPDVELRGLCQNGLLRMPVAMVPPPRGGLAFEMVVEFGVENTLGKRLLQLVEKPVLVENLFRVTAVQNLQGPAPWSIVGSPPVRLEGRTP